MVQNSEEAPQKIKCRTIILSRNFTFGVFIQNNWKKDIKEIFGLPGLFTRAKWLKQTKWPSTYEWIEKIWYKHTMENY